MIELAAAVTIISFMAYLVLPYGHDLYLTQKKAVTYKTIKMMRSALEQYARDHNGAYPRKLKGLIEQDYMREIPFNIYADTSDWQIARRTYEPYTEIRDPSITQYFEWNITKGWKKKEQWVMYKPTSEDQAPVWATTDVILPRNPKDDDGVTPLLGPHQDKDSGDLEYSYWGICNVRSTAPLGIDPEEDLYDSIEILIYADSNRTYSN